MNSLVEPLARALDRAPPSWRPLVDAWRHSPTGTALIDFVDARQAAGATIFPGAVLRSLELTPREAVRVVILGQDPYHGPGQAEGIAFSVPAGVKLPPSLRNVFKELRRDLGVAMPRTGHLAPWARQGVLLLNTSLTVEAGRAGSHANHGWEALTTSIVEELSRDRSPKVFMLWGNPAQRRAAVLTPDIGHCVLRSNHPSPLSALRPPRPFLGNGHFGEANRFLTARGGPPIDWRLD